MVSNPFSHIGLFEGIGGFSLAASWMGWETKAWCEWNEFGQRVLRYHFPKAEGFGDITKTDFTKYENTIDLVSGGFPCQPFSVAGKRKGKEDDRFLWKEMLRAIREIQPPWIVGENVSGIISIGGGMVFREVQIDLENEGYEVLPFLLPACSIGASHRRERCWFVAYSNDKRLSRIEQRIGLRETGKMEIATETLFPCQITESYNDLPKPTNISSHDGFSFNLDTGAISKNKWREQSIKAYGNAIVPQVALQIFKAIEAYEKTS